MQITVVLGILLAIKTGLATNDDTWDDVQIICPNQCVCQRSHLMDLSIARWTEQTHFNAKTNDASSAAHNQNEATYELDGDNENPFLKMVMCILQDNANVKDVIASLPPDVQGLVLLYNNGADKNISLLASELSPLQDLTVLEVRGSEPSALRFLLDEPLPNMRYANFEMIELIGTRPQPPNPVHPAEIFDYVPESERNDYNVSMAVDEELEIVPYEVYVLEEKLAKMATFNGWSALYVLRVHRCRLDELHWEMFDGLRNLEHLSLERNAIKIIPPFAFFGALHIRTLSLAHNRILDLNYRALAGLLRLEWLDLSHNELTHLSELSFPPFPKLRTVDFRANPVRSIFPMTFAVMNHTEHLFLGSVAAALDLTKERLFQSLGGMQTLRIENATAASLHQNVFSGLHGLRTLQLRGHIQRIEFDAFAEMSAARELVLSECELQEISMDIFYGAHNLEVIDMSRNRLRFLPPGLFDQQTRLREVYLHENLLTALPKDIFLAPSMKLMRLIDNPWRCSCRMTFWKQSITNAVRQGRTNQRCVIDPTHHTGVRCNDNTYSFHYEYDNKMTPRCAVAYGHPDDAGRSVYYTLRKTLRCNTPHGLRTAVKLLPSNGTLATTKRNVVLSLSEKQLRAIRLHRKQDMEIQRENQKKLYPSNNRKQKYYQQRRKVSHSLDNNDLDTELSNDLP